MTLNFPPASYIQTDKDLRKLAKSLAKEPLLAIDTESNSLYAYRERVCLIQLSTRKQDYIIDPLVVNDLKPLAPLLANPKIEKVFHAAEYDLICLKRDFGFTVNNMFDTMIAARICGHKLIGLGNLLAQFAGVQVDKSHQRDDWGQRPLPEASLHYAQMDTHYLPVLRDRLYDELKEANALQEAQEAFTFACEVNIPSNGFDPEGYWRISIPNGLTARQTAILRELYLLRESLAKQRDVPPFKVFTDKLLIALAVNEPRNPKAFQQVDGMSAGQARRYGKQLLDAIARADSSKLPPPPNRPEAADPVVVERYTQLREWRKKRAQKRGVESDVIIARDALWSLAERMPKTLDEMQGIPGLGPWRLNAYGDELLALIAHFRGK